MHRAARLCGRTFHSQIMCARPGARLNYLLRSRWYSDMSSDSSSPMIMSLSPAEGNDLILHDNSSLFESVLNEIESGLIFIHDTSGLPWWATLVTSTVLFRVTLFPLVYGQMKAGQNMANAKFQLEYLILYL